MSTETSPTLESSDVLEQLERLDANVDRLRKTVLRHGQAQELFQERIDVKIERMTAAVDTDETSHVPLLDPAQLRALLALDKALLAMHRATSTRGPVAARAHAPGDEAPASVREGLDLLHIRVRNLQHSFGLEPIPALGRRFDDRLHRAESTCARAEIPDREIVEEILPGYRLGDQVLRPALVVVNQRPVPPKAPLYEES